MAAVVETKDLTIEFVADRFDCTSDLSEKADAGNRLYGKDLAEFLCEGLGRHGIEADYLYEDWGWLVQAKDPNGAHVEIGVYDWPYQDGPEGTWRLRVASFVRGSWLVLKRRHAVPNSPPLVQALRALVAGDEFRVTLFGVADDW